VRYSNECVSYVYHIFGSTADDIYFLRWFLQVNKFLEEQLTILLFIMKIRLLI